MAKAKLKSVPAKMTFDQYVDSLPVNRYSFEVVKILNGYSDCLPDHVSVKGCQRDLDFLSRLPINIDQLKIIMKAAVPNGYNCFDASKSLDSFEELFGKDAKYFVAREGSVCIYIKTSIDVWLNGRKTMPKCDEFSFDSDLGMFRVWWD